MNFNSGHKSPHLKMIIKTVGTQNQDSNARKEKENLFFSVVVRSQVEDCLFKTCLIKTKASLF